MREQPLAIARCHGRRRDRRRQKIRRCRDRDESSHRVDSSTAIVVDACEEINPLRPRSWPVHPYLRDLFCATENLATDNTDNTANVMLVSCIPSPEPRAPSPEPPSYRATEPAPSTEPRASVDFVARDGSDVNRQDRNRGQFLHLRCNVQLWQLAETCEQAIECCTVVARVAWPRRALDGMRGGRRSWCEGI